MMSNMAAAVWRQRSMRILYVNSPLYDFLAATLIEGVNELSREQPVELSVVALSNYAKRKQVWTKEQVHQARDRFDLVILGTNLGVDDTLFWEVSREDNRVCVDGSDASTYEHDPRKFRLYFKRELLESAAANVLPCPFAVERRWLRPPDASPRYFVSACFGPRPGPRQEILNRLQRVDGADTFVGAVPTSRLAKWYGIWLGQCTWRTSRQNAFGVGHNRAYYDILRSSLLSVAVRGDGVDTGRWWEILGAGALLVAESRTVEMPHPFVPMEHYIPFSSAEDLADKLAWARRHSARIDHMRRLAREHCLAYHTTRERARYVLDTVRQTFGLSLTSPRPRTP
jgi:Glycosyl transferases group 1